MPTLQAEVGALVRHHRELKNLTQARLAEEIERSIELVGRIERGQAAPSFDTLEAIAKALNTPVREFFGTGKYSAGSRQDALSTIVSKLALLDPETLRWIEQLIDVATTRPKK